MICASQYNCLSHAAVGVFALALKTNTAFITSCGTGSGREHRRRGWKKNVWSSISKGLKLMVFLFLLRLEFLFLTQYLINDSLHLDLKLTDLPLLYKAEEGVMSSPRPGEDLKRKVRGH